MVVSTRRLFTAILFGALFIMAVREVTDPDFWWHLRTGQFILETRSIPHADIYSFTNAGKEWVAHEWLSEVIIYFLYSAGGMPLLTILFAGIIACTFALTYERSEGRPYVAGFCVLLGAAAALPTWGVRPQMLSLLMTSIYLLFLERNDRTGDMRYLLPLVPLMAMWANLHSGFALGLLILAVYAISASIAHYSRRTPVTRGRALALGLSCSLAVAVVALNPNGLRLYTYPFETLTSPAMQAYIQEWFSPDFHLVEFQPFAVLLLALLMAALLSRSEISLPTMVLLLVTGYASLRSARQIPIFSLVAVPVLARQVTQFLRSRGWNNPGMKEVGTRHPVFVVLNLTLLVALLVGMGIRCASVFGNQLQAVRAKFPVHAVDWISGSPPSSLFNAYTWGGYLIWRLGPNVRVYIDGRADVYGDKFMEDYARIYGAQPGWEERLASNGTDIALIETGSPLALAMSRSGAWRCAYQDTLSVIYERNP